MRSRKLPDVRDLARWSQPARICGGRWSGRGSLAIPASDPQALCQSCRLTRVISDLSQPGNKEAWYQLEVAKRRLVYSLTALGLPVLNKEDDPEQGLVFEFLSDSSGDS